MSDDEQEDPGETVREGSAARADEPKVCINCEEPIELEKWHPVVGDRDDDGTFRLYAFCSEDCRDEWDD